MESDSSREQLIQDTQPYKSHPPPSLFQGQGYLFKERGFHSHVRKPGTHIWRLALEMQTVGTWKKTAGSMGWTPCILMINKENQRWKSNKMRKDRKEDSEPGRMQVGGWRNVTSVDKDQKDAWSVSRVWIAILMALVHGEPRWKVRHKAPTDEVLLEMNGMRWFPAFFVGVFRKGVFSLKNTQCSPPLWLPMMWRGRSLLRVLKLTATMTTRNTSPGNTPALTGKLINWRCVLGSHRGMKRHVCFMSSDDIRTECVCYYVFSKNAGLCGLLCVVTHESRGPCPVRLLCAWFFLCLLWPGSLPSVSKWGNSIMQPGASYKRKGYVWTWSPQSRFTMTH